MKHTRIAILASGTGSNALALIKHFESHPSIHAALVISNKDTCGALGTANEKNIATELLSNAAIEDDQTLLTLLKQHAIDIVVLAGFLRKIPVLVVQAFPDRIINIHPSILPEFGGKGMYGARVHQAVIDAHKKSSGITIHVVNEHYDEGHYIAQFFVRVTASDDASSLEHKIRALEQRYFPTVVEGYINSLTD
jgi:phosphoribosylglycinamide formyltransferase-1